MLDLPSAAIGQRSLSRRGFLVACVCTSSVLARPDGQKCLTGPGHQAIPCDGSAARSTGAVGVSVVGLSR
jgi:hypothetical protein